MQAEQRITGAPKTGLGRLRWLGRPWDGFRCSKSPMVTGLGTLGHLISPGGGGKEFRVGRTTGPLETIQLSQPFPEFPTFRSLSPSCSQFFPLIPAFSHNFPLVPVISRYRHDAPFLAFCFVSPGGFSMPFRFLCASLPSRREKPRRKPTVGCGRLREGISICFAVHPRQPPGRRDRSGLNGT